MGFFSLFSTYLLWMIIRHLLRLSEASNVAVLALWLGNLPMIIVALCALISVPYSVAKTTTALSDLASMAKAFRKDQQ